MRDLRRRYNPKPPRYNHPGITVSGSYSVLKLHFNCLEDFQGICQRKEKIAKEQQNQWGKIADDIKDVETTLEDIKGPFTRDFWKRIKDIYQKLFPNGLISKRLKIGIRNEHTVKRGLGEKLGQAYIDYQSSYDLKKTIYISSTGIGFKNWGTQAYYAKNLKGFIYRLPLTIVFRKEMSDKISNYNDRNEKFNLFSKTLEEILTEDLLKVGNKDWIGEIDVNPQKHYSEYDIEGLRLSADKRIYRKSGTYPNVSLNPEKNDVKELSNLLPDIKQLVKKTKKNQSTKAEQHHNKIKKMEDKLGKFILAKAI